MPASENRNKKDVIRKYLSDLIYGANDGLITTFAIVAGVTGASLSSAVVLILGFASLLADGFSMASSDYLAERTPGGGRDQTSKKEAMRHGLATFLGFVFPGVVPLLTYLLPIDAQYQFPLAAALTLLTLFIVGASRAAASELRWWIAGLEMLLVGALAAAVAYGVGALGAMINDGAQTIA